MLTSSPPPPSIPQPRKAVVGGLVASGPIVLGYLPIAFSFGVAAVKSGFSPSEAIFLSAVIYAGASQFVALVLLAGAAPMGVAVVTLLIMNLRHVLYAPTLLDRAGHDRQTRWAWLWSFGLTDEVFAASIAALARGKIRFSEWWMTAIGASAYLTWVIGTALGALLGSGLLAAYPAVDAALGFMLPALFLSLLLSIASRRQLPVIAVAGATCAAVTLSGSPTSGVLAGMIAGAITGAINLRGRVRS